MLGLAAALAVALAMCCYWITNPTFDAIRWQQSALNRDVRMAEAAGTRVQGLSVEEAVFLLGHPDDRSDTVLVYRLPGFCGSRISFDPCDLVLFISDGRVSSAGIADTGAPPEEEGLRCLAGVAKHCPRSTQEDPSEVLGAPGGRSDVLGALRGLGGRYRPPPVLSTPVGTMIASR